jgi:hypothetical protein
MEEPVSHMGDLEEPVHQLDNRDALNSRGFTYLSEIVETVDVEAAIAEVNEAFKKGQITGNQAYSRINSHREQVKLGRDLAKLSPKVRLAVQALEERWKRHWNAEDGEFPPLMDVYALRTAADEKVAEARAAQAWHLDDCTKFPVAALILLGCGATEFHAGPYADLSQGCTPETIAEWTKDWRHGRWEDKEKVYWQHSESIAEQQHWRSRLREAGLLSEDNDRCNWNRLDEDKPENAGAGDGVLFWSNKVHRGPATEDGVERIVLFVSWNWWAARGKMSVHAASPTDYSFFEWHLSPKLRLSERADRLSKRQKRG